MTTYHVSTEGPDGRLPVLRQAWLTWRLDGKGQPEFHGIYQTESDARADPICATAATGWKIAQLPLIAWHCIALRVG